MSHKTPLDRALTRAALRAKIANWRNEGLSVGFVPTMGALHDGHLSLVSIARKKADRVVASIFVNPTQFAPGEDFDTYPRTEEEDCAKLASVGCDLVYLPQVEEMYPDGSVTNVRVEELSDLLDGGPRPHFFYGVATVVARLFLHVQPDFAVFGEKDYQQLQIIRRMVRDLGFPIDIIGGSTFRDPDGLAQSSRNAYLKPNERPIAGAMQAALHRLCRRLEAGANREEAIAEAHGFLLKSGFDKVDYVTAVDPATLEALTGETVAPDFIGRVLGAGWVGETRLIDNMGFERPTN